MAKAKTKITDESGGLPHHAPILQRKEIPEPAPAPQPPPEPAPAPQIPPEPAPAPQPPPESAPAPQSVDLFSEDELTGIPLGTAPGSPADSEGLLPGETDAQRKIRLGKKPTGRPLGSKNTKQPDKANFSDVVAASQNFRGMAEMTFGLATGMLSNIFGPEWQPANPDEKEGVVKPLEEYFRVKQMPDLPPGWLVVIACMAYSAPRLHHPNTRAKIKNTVNRLRGKNKLPSTAPMPGNIPV
jgi:hypothetical protein